MTNGGVGEESAKRPRRETCWPSREALENWDPEGVSQRPGFGKLGVWDPEAKGTLNPQREAIWLAKRPRRETYRPSRGALEKWDPEGVSQKA